MGRKARSTFEVDKQLLRSELGKRGYDFRRASIKMGYSGSYLAVMTGEKQGGRLSQTTLNLLQQTFGIRAEVIGKGYVPHENKPEPCATITPRIDYTKPYVEQLKAAEKAQARAAEPQAATNDTQIEIMRLVYNTLMVFAMELNRIIDKAKGE